MRTLFILCAATLAAQTNSVVDRLLTTANRTTTYSGIAISTGGERLAWVQGTAGTRFTLLHIARRGGGDDVEIAPPGTSKSRQDKSPAWSPDSTRVAFFSDTGDGGNPDLWIADAASYTVNRLASFKGYADRPRWSPDGTSIAFLHIDGASGGGPLVAAGPLTGVIDTKFHNQRIGIFNVATGQFTVGSPADRHVYDFDWSPDSKRFAATAAAGPGDNNWWIAQLYVIDAASATGKPIYKPKLQIAVPRWSPDGKRIAFIEGLMSDEGFHGGDLYTIAANGGAATDHMLSRRTSASSIAWQTPDGLLFSEYIGGGVNLATLNLKTGSIEPRWHGDEEARAAGNFPNLSVARDGQTVAIVRSNLQTPPEVWAGPVGEWKQITHGNAGIQARWGKPESIESASEGRRIQAWLLPPSTSGPGKQPMVVLVHGGPSGVTVPSWPGDGIAALLASTGYYVLLPNPRGSYGQGEAFTRANVRDFGYGDLRDILAATDAAIGHYPIDPQRLGITGWSYGGYMTMFAITQTTRFKAAVAGAGIANWTSYYGENLIDQWMIPFFGASVYEDPAVYARSSPINFIKRVKTPTLVVVGEQDAECPAPQSFEFWHALKTLGVPTELVVYPGEGHRFVKPENKRDEGAQALAWFDKYLK
jgi:dipeptidyl aminopeptidase/acylaminoacyl peptidase